MATDDGSGGAPPYLPLSGRTVLFGVTGGIAAYKAADYARRLVSLGGRVHVVMTRNATRFVTPLTFEALTGERVRVDLFGESGAETIPHISLARKSDLFVCLPATANFLAKAANGLADDLLSTLFLAFSGPRLVFPAMNPVMYGNPATRANIARLMEFGVTVGEPESGAMACGQEGPGRLPEWESVKEAVLGALSPKGLEGRTVLVAAGPTREPLDPVRFLSNRSSGLMGASLARVARRRGAYVRLVWGPSSVPPPPGVTLHRVETAAEMSSLVEGHSSGASVVIMAAAVADYTPRSAAPEKIKKDAGSLSVDLVRTKDILTGLVRGRVPGQVIVGFAAETGDVVGKALAKCRVKGVDLLVGNDVSEPGSGFDVETNRVWLLTPDGSVEGLPFLHKEEVAGLIWDKVESILGCC